MFDENKYIKELEFKYKKNLEVLKEFYPELVKKVEKQKLFQKYHLMPTGKNQNINLYSVEKDMFVYDIENPYDSIKKDFESVKGYNKNFVVLLGLGIGYEFQYLYENVFENSDFEGLIIIEKDIELFKLTMHGINFSEFISSPKVLFLIDKTKEEVFTGFHNYLNYGNSRLYSYLSTIKYYYHAKTILLNKDYYMPVIYSIKDSIQNLMINVGNSPEDSMIGFKNMLLNMEEIIQNPGVNLLFEKFHGRPAVIVSTGPSLNKNKHLLKDIQDKALIICPEASLKILLEMGVKPHIITSLERIPEVIPLVDGYSAEEVKDVYLGACPVVVPEVYQAYKGPRLIVYRSYRHFAWTGVDRGMLKIQASAGNMAYKVADALHCDPIVLIGQDLAYTRDGRSHAKGAFYGETDYIDRFDDRLEVMGNDGEMLPTNLFLEVFREGFELDISISTAKCINATEGGAYIAGTEIMTFQETIDKYIQESFNPLGIIKENLASFTEKNIEEDRSRFLEICKKSIDNFDFYIKKSQEGLDFIDSIEADLDKYLGTKEFDEDKLKFYIRTITNEYLNKIMDDEMYLLILANTIQPIVIRLYNNITSGYDKCENQNEARIFHILELKKWLYTVQMYSKMTKPPVEETYKRLSSKE